MKKLLILFSFLFALTNCAKEEAPAPEVDLISYNVVGLNYYEGSFTIKAKCSTGYEKLIATFEEDWLTLKECKKGETAQEGEMTFTYEENQGKENRTAIIKIGAEGTEPATIIKVKQEAKPYVKFEAASPLNVPAAGGEFILNIETNQENLNYFHFDENDPDLILTVVNEDEDNKKYTISISENTTTAERTASVEIYYIKNKKISAELEIKQAAPELVP